MDTRQGLQAHSQWSTALLVLFARKAIMVDCCCIVSLLSFSCKVAV